MRRVGGAGAKSAGRRAGFALTLAFAVFLPACSSRGPLPVLGSVPDFQLTAQTGEPFESRSLAGNVWVANFIFTTCTGPCPMMTAQMRRIQNSTAETPDVKLVSFTVDPANDTPQALAAYARKFSADSARWYFLTGVPARLDDLAFNTFHLNRVDGSMIHSTRFVLMDRQRRIRGFYATEQDDFMERLLRDIRRLEREA